MTLNNNNNNNNNTHKLREIVREREREDCISYSTQ